MDKPKTARRIPAIALAAATLGAGACAPSEEVASNTSEATENPTMTIEERARSATRGSEAGTGTASAGDEGNSRFRRLPEEGPVPERVRRMNEDREDGESGKDTNPSGPPPEIMSPRPVEEPE